MDSKPEQLVDTMNYSIVEWKQIDRTKSKTSVFLSLDACCLPSKIHHLSNWDKYWILSREIDKQWVISRTCRWINQWRISHVERNIFSILRHDTCFWSSMKKVSSNPSINLRSIWYEREKRNLSLFRWVMRKCQGISRRLSLTKVSSFRVQSSSLVLSI